MDTYETLMFVEDDDDFDDDEFDTTDDEEKYDPDYEPSPKKGRGRWDIFTDEEMEAIYKLRYSNKGKKLISFNTVKAAHRRLESEDHMKWVCRRYKNKSNWMKKKEIEELLINKFRDARANDCRVHDRDLKRWAMKEARKLNYESYKCSPNWINRFKRRNRIGVRKITVFVTNKSIKEGKEIMKECADFLSTVRERIPHFDRSKVFNTDQSGFSKELHTNHTLEIIGERRVKARVQSVSALTHSYTIQPLISMDGTLYSPMLLVLQEPKGVFGPVVSQRMKRPPNFVIKASRSHIVTKEIVKDWFIDQYFPVAGNNSLLILDALPAYRDRSLINALKPPNTNYEVRSIPEGGTKYVQPLDVFFFRQWKAFAKFIHDHVIMEDIDVNMFSRDEIIILQSLIHNQFSNEKFRTFRIESWKKSGYIDTNQPFLSPVDYCFNLTGDCSGNDCDGYSMIKCSFCDKELCFQHFFTEEHSHF